MQTIMCSAKDEHLTHFHFFFTLVWVFDLFAICNQIVCFSEYWVPHALFSVIYKNWPPKKWNIAYLSMSRYAVLHNCISVSFSHDSMRRRIWNKTDAVFPTIKHSLPPCALSVWYKHEPGSITFPQYFSICEMVRVSLMMMKLLLISRNLSSQISAIIPRSLSSQLLYRFNMKPETVSFPQLNHLSAGTTIQTNRNSCGSLVVRNRSRQIRE